MTGSRPVLDPETEQRVQDIADELRECDDISQWKQVSDRRARQLSRRSRTSPAPWVEAGVDHEDANYAVARFRIEKTTILHCLDQEQTEEARASRFARRRRAFNPPAPPAPWPAGFMPEPEPAPSADT